MTDDVKEGEITTVELEERPVINDEFVNEYSANKEVIKFIKKQFKRLSQIGTINLVRMLLWKQLPIRADQIVVKSKSLIRWNLSKFDNNSNLEEDEVENLRILLNGFLVKIGKEILIYDDDKNKDFEITKIDGVNYYILDNHTLYKKVRKLTCDEGGEVVFKYHFKDTVCTPPGNVDILQCCQIQILTQGVKFHYPIEFVYGCPQCGGKTRMKAYETASTNNRIGCPNIYSYVTGDGEPRSRVCRLNLNPDNEISDTKDAYYFDIGYEDIEGNKHPAGAISFEKLKPGYYECALFRINNPKKTELYQIMDIKPIESNVFEFPQKVEGENYVFGLQKSFDTFIKRQTGMEIYGLFPIKISLILQTVMNYIKQRLVGNVQIVGDASTGKSTILKYYGFLLNSHLNLSSNGLSISVAALRGTREAINLMGKESKIVTVGYLGTYKSIHIDEAGENKTLVQNLKTFLVEDNYSYDKAGATGIFNKRTTHVNISENLDYNHLGQYRGAIRKAYKELTIKIGDTEKPEWSAKWDLHLPIFQYENPYLHKVIKEKRLEYKQKQQFWIDGYDYALHERFPFYFYLVNEKQDKKFNTIVKGNISRGTISENLELMRALKSEDIEKFFASLIKYVKSDSDFKSFDKVDEILKQYGIHTDARINEFFYGLVKVSRILNKRRDVNKEDYDLLRWLLEKINCKLDVSDTTDYEIKGAPDLEAAQKIEQKIEDETVEAENEFGLPNGDFQ